MSRWSRFSVALIIGLILGLIFGWFIKPVEIVDISPSLLSLEYRSDLVLMVSEVYASSFDLDSSIYALTTLFSQSPSASISFALTYASENGYTQIDLSHLQSLAEAVNSRLPGVSP